jgi:hypothetical protein
VRATFERRRTPIPETLPVALTPAFAALGSKLSQWRGFLAKSGVTSAPRDFERVTRIIAEFLEPVIRAARVEAPLNTVWPPGDPWQPGGSAVS